MATAEQPVETQEAQLDKGLKSGALGLISTTVIATASVAPAYSIAATLGLSGPYALVGHRFVTDENGERTGQPASSGKIRRLMVAREGIEPPTRGFSVRCSTN